MQRAARRYIVASGDYFADLEAGLGRAPDASDFEATNARRCREPIGQLIRRYGIRGKHLISVGSGRGFEEYWFAQAGNRLVMLDADEGIARHLDQLATPSAEIWPPAAGNSGGGDFEFVIAPVEAYLEAAAGAGSGAASGAAEFDVVYISSLAPAEHMREETMAGWKQGQASAAHPDSEAHPDWPPGTAPLWPGEIGTGALLKPGGLLILQSYRGGPPLDRDPAFLQAMAAQLAEAGLQLLECFCIRFDSGVKLLVAVKGSPDDARRLAAALQAAPPVTSIHGRHPHDALRNDVYRLDVLGGEVVLGEKALSKQPTHLVTLCAEALTTLPESGLAQTFGTLMDRYGLAGSLMRIAGNLDDALPLLLYEAQQTRAGTPSGPADGPVDAVFISNDPAGDSYRVAILKAYAAAADRVAGQTWPPGMPLFAMEQIDLAAHLSPGGLLFVQIYYEGVNVVRNPHLPDLVRDQLAGAGLHLLECFYFQSSPTITLWVAVKGADQAADRARRLAVAPKLAAIHGRYPDAALRGDLGHLIL